MATAATSRLPLGWTGQGVRRSGLLLLALTLTTVVYYPITQNYFHGDDFVYLYELSNHQFLQFLLRPQAGHVQLARNLIFSLFYFTFGTEPAWYFRVVLLTHLANVALLFRLVWRFTGSAGLACFGAALWGAAAFHDETLGWYSVYGQVLVATLLLGVLVHVTRAASESAPPRYAPYLWYAALVVASLCFGVGTAIALAFPPVVVALWPAVRARRDLVRLFSSLLLVVPALYVLLHWLYSLTPGALPQASSRFLEIAVLRWPSVLRMIGGLLAVGAISPLLGPLESQLPGPDLWVVGVTAVYVAAVIALALRGSTTRRHQLFACIVLAVSSYSMVAFGRAGLYVALKYGMGVTVHRYHYVASIPLAVVTCLILDYVSQWSPLRYLRSNFTLAVWAGLMCVSVFRAPRALEHYDNDRHYTAQVLQVLRSQIANAAAGRPVYIANQEFRPMDSWWVTPPILFPGWAGLYLIFFPDNVVDGKRVYFVEHDEQLVAALRARPRTRVAALLVTPAEVPGGHAAVRGLPFLADQPAFAPVRRTHSPSAAQS